VSAIDESAEIDVDPAWVAERLAGDPAVELVDVRETYEREAGYIGGSRHIELTALAGAAAELDSGRAIIFYCRLGSRSQMAAQALRASGFEAYSMRGGLERWAGEGRALEPDGGYVADH
jgi:hydroxyacylglutathione hydrolase/adenylyltransferase/sulfurtransferase